MSIRKLIGAVLIAGGVLALVYGGFSFTKETHKVDIGVAELKIDEKEKVKLPPWVGVAAIIVGGALLAIGKK